MMMKKIAICALIALILVPAGVMAVKFGGNSTGAAHGQGPWLQDGQHRINQTCNQTCAPGLCTPAQYRNGTEQRGSIGACSDNGLCTRGENQTRSMGRLHDGSGRGCKNTPAVTP